MKIKGFLPGISTERTFLFRFDRLLKHLPIRQAVNALTLLVHNKQDVYVRDEKGGSWFDFVPGQGRIRRPCLVGFRGVLALSPIRDDFIVTPIRSVLPAKLGTQVWTTTDCPMSTDGIGRYLYTDQAVFITIIKGVAGTRRSAWKEF